MINIAIIGAGNIGSRHLQAIKKINRRLQIFVIDPSLKSLQTAKDRYKQIKVGHKKEHLLYYHQNLQFIEHNLDFAIIATNSDIRKSVITKLLDHTDVKNMILEKILFQKREDYDSISQLLKNKEVKAWVNTPIQTMKFFSILKKNMKRKQITYIIHGCNWGLMSNSVHFIAYMGYLSDCYDFKVDVSNLVPKLIPSKRRNFSEMNGIINIHFKNGNHCFLQCISSNQYIRNQELITEDERILILEKLGKAFIYKNNLSEEQIPEKVKANYEYQSNLTNQIITKIIETGNCNLPSYKFSKKIHLQFFEPILKHIKKNINSEFNHYPFT